METGIEISDPRQALRVVLIGGTALLLIAAGIGALVLVPVLARADRALDAMEQALPVVEEQIASDVASLESDVDGLPEDVAAMLEELQGVGNELGGVSDGIGKLQNPLQDVASGVAGLRQDIAPLALLSGVLDAVRVLPEMLDALEGTRDEVAQVDGSVKEVNASIGALVERLDQMLVLLDEIEKHVENIDRKTGPVAPPDPEGNDP